MPPAPLETKYHPSAVDLLLIKRLIAETSKQNLLQFLQHEFVNVGKAHAERLIGKTYMQLLLFKKNNAGIFKVLIYGIARVYKPPSNGSNPSSL